MSDAPRIAFKLSSSKRTIVTNTPKNQFEPSTNTSTTDEQTVELVTGFSNGQITSTTPVVVKQELIIPSQPNAHHRFLQSKINVRQQISAPITEEMINQIDDEAKRALILDAQAANEAWNERDENGTTRVHTIEQHSHNTFTTNLDNQLATKTDAEEEQQIDNADYDQVPIEDFGMAVLRGMGYKDDSGLGISNKKQVDVFVPETRPRGLGLGADRKVLEKVNELKRNLKKSGINENDDLCMEKGACVLVEKGLYADQYGIIEWIEEDVSRLTVTLAIGGTNKKKEVISISQYNVKLVTEKEYLKYSKYVNKSKADRVEKETSERLLEEYQHGDKSKRHRSSKDDNNDDEQKHRPSSSSSSSREHRRHRDETSKSSRRH